MVEAAGIEPAPCCSHTNAPPIHTSATIVATVALFFADLITGIVSLLPSP